ATTGDEIIVAGKRFHTGTRVITWQDPGGYNGYAGLPPFALRHGVLSPGDEARVRQHGWTVPELQKAVDQFVLHYDVCGVSKVCFNVLHQRALSVHFLLDVDGTIYQTIDLQERALHATVANSRSIGVEIANIGAYPPDEAAPLDEWYAQADRLGAVIRVPGRIGNPGIATPHFVGRPARPDPVVGTVQGETRVQYDFTPQQYAALVRLTAALCRIFPRITCDYPHNWLGRPITHKLPDRELANYHGILGHYHIQANKDDPGPAFQWRRFIAGVRALR
ncbi:MAG TPA: N-acetylmuramoyl-L-alanine amidase, partial [Opitutus sp.]|nr:N-acetylmuramoyl-L-alanine amidase [Opitutus sp.]